MSRSGRASDLINSWADGKHSEHILNCKAWDADPCDRCTYEAFNSHEILYECAVILEWVTDERT